MIAGALCILFGCCIIVGAFIGKVITYNTPNYSQGWDKQQVWDP